MKNNDDQHHIPGTLLWTKCGRYPYWPCMVSNDPKTGRCSKVLKKGNIAYHVQYFGDKPDRGYVVPGKKTFLYEGLDKFYTKMGFKNLHSQLESYGADWKIAVKESEEAFSVSCSSKRIKKYEFIYPFSVTNKSAKNTADNCGNTIKKKQSAVEGEQNSVEGEQNTVEVEQSAVTGKLKRKLDFMQVSQDKAKSRKLSSISSQHKKLCAVCDKPSADFSCTTCLNVFHFSCQPKIFNLEDFRCGECLSGCHTCEICDKTEKEVVKCSHSKCFKFYHSKCLNKFKFAKPEKKLCPSHVCLTCYKENPRNVMASKGALVYCLRCPIAFHSRDCCIPAGCKILNTSANYIICSFHFIKEQLMNSLLPYINLDYCIVCQEGGNLICCETCTNAYHANVECGDLKNIPKNAFICDECAERKHFYHKMVVWVKISNFRWWPAKIIHPSDVPDAVKRLQYSPGDFPVQFLGTHDYAWTNRGRVYNYDCEHKNIKGHGNKKYDLQYKEALEEAEVVFAEYLEYRECEVMQLEHPEKYKVIKVNHVSRKFRNLYFLNNHESDQCNCKESEENPCSTNSCLNRSTYVECQKDNCIAGSKCQNQKFSKRIYKSLKVFKTSNRGFGVAALEHIKKGEFVIEYVGEIISHEEYERRSEELRKKDATNYYFLYLDSRRMIDAGRMGNTARFINHSCDPNCEMVKWVVASDLRVGIFASRDISDGEEVTFDYKLEKCEFEQKCLCGTTPCRQFIGCSESRPMKPTSAILPSSSTSSVKSSFSSLKEKNLNVIKKNSLKVLTVSLKRLTDVEIKEYKNNPSSNTTLNSSETTLNISENAFENELSIHLQSLDISSLPCHQRHSPITSPRNNSDCLDLLSSPIKFASSPPSGTVSDKSRVPIISAASSDYQPVALPSSPTVSVNFKSSEEHQTKAQCKVSTGIKGIEPTSSQQFSKEEGSPEIFSSPLDEEQFDTNNASKKNAVDIKEASSQTETQTIDKKIFESKEIQTDGIFIQEKCLQVDEDLNQLLETAYENFTVDNVSVDSSIEHLYNTADCEASHNLEFEISERHTSIIPIESFDVSLGLSIEVSSSDNNFKEIIPSDIMSSTETTNCIPSIEELSYASSNMSSSDSFLRTINSDSVTLPSNVDTELSPVLQELLNCSSTPETNFCFLCFEKIATRPSVTCSDFECLKIFHLECALGNVLRDEWVCPSHKCIICSMESVTRCIRCTTAFCGLCLERENAPFECQICKLKIKWQQRLDSAD